MKKFGRLVLQVGFAAFAVAAFFAILNYLTGWHLGIKGAALPGDPALAVLFLVIAGICGGLLLLTNRKREL